MKARVLLFSVLRDLVGAERIEVDLPEGANLGGLVEAMAADFPALVEWEGRMLLAVNGEYAGRDVVLADGDEVALMPPVQGG